MLRFAVHLPQHTRSVVGLSGSGHCGSSLWAASGAAPNSLCDVGVLVAIGGISCEHADVQAFDRNTSILVVECVSPPRSVEELQESMSRQAHHDSGAVETHAEVLLRRTVGSVSSIDDDWISVKC